MNNTDIMRKIINSLAESTNMDFEKVAFGDFQNRRERDTKDEARIFLALRSFIRGATPENKATADAALKELLHLKSRYPEVLEPNADVCYRGTQLQKQDYMKLVAQGNKKKLLRIDYTYSPRSSIQSWTTRNKVAASFALNGGDGSGTGWHETEYPYPAIIQVTVDQTFVMNSEFTDRLSRDAIGHSESEIIRISSTPIKAVLLIKNEWLEHYARDPDWIS